MLDNFRSQSITWDMANKKFHETIELSSSDEQGRRIVVHVLDRGQVVDLTGAGLNLYWETPDKHYMGLDNFEALDIRKGKFGLYVTTEMLSHIGKLNGLLYIVDMEGKAITSLRLEFRVHSGINAEAIESQNSFSALTNAFSRLVGIETAEALRKEQEWQRVIKEEARELAEELRKSQESTRQSNESGRKSAESTRVSQENARKSAETTRVSQENTRKSNETAREQLKSTNEQLIADLQSYDGDVAELFNLVGLGGVAESGENEHGSFVKFNDGTLMCLGRVEAKQGNGYRLETNWTYPVPYIVTPYVYSESGVYGGYGADEGHFLAPKTVKKSKDTSTFWIYRYTGSTLSLVDKKIPIDTLAIGRWK